MSCVYCNLSLQYSYSFHLRKNTTKHLRSQVPRRPLTKELIDADRASVHDHMLHSAVYRNWAVHQKL